jgi:hypothetical protein
LQSIPAAWTAQLFYHTRCDVLLSSRNLAAPLSKKDTVTGLLLAGIGNVDNKSKPNFLIVDASGFEGSDRDNERPRT